MRSRPPIAAPLLALLALAGCSKTSAPPPVAPPPPPPPQISVVSPAPRSVFVDYLTTIWADFAVPLDPTTVTPQNVYLKIDTVRQPIALTYDVVARRVRIQPLAPLALSTTYTVEFSASLAGADGTPLGAPYLWQFTTTTVRHPANPFPADRGVESPFTSMTWGGNETTPGPLTYEVYAGPDSALVAARGLPYLYRGTRTQFIPTVPWASYAPTFWSVTVENAAAGERANGAVWRFDTPGADAPIDSLVVGSTDYGYRLGSTFTGSCSDVELVTGGNYVSGIAWQLTSPPATTRVAGVSMALSATTAYQDSLPGECTLWATTVGVRCISVVLATPDGTTGVLATGVPIGPRTLSLASDKLSLHVQTAFHFRNLFGYRYQSTKLIHWVAPLSPEVAFRPVFKVYYYTGNGTIGPGPAGPAAPAAPAADGAPIAPGARAARAALARFSRLTHGPIHR